MNPLVYISAELYFEVTGAAMYGGPGSIGYTSIGLGGVKDITQITDEYVEAQTQAMANFLEVPRAAIRLISKDDYDQETEDEGWEDDWEMDGD